MKTPKTAVVVYDRLQKNKAAIEKAIPKHIAFDRFAMMIITAIRANSKLAECPPESIYACACQAAQMGIEPDGALGQAWLVPRWNKETKRKEAYLQIGYRGLMHLAYQSGRVDYIKGEVVCVADEFDFQEGTDSFLKHKKALGDRGERLCTYAVVKFKDGSTSFKILTPGDIEQRENESKSKDRGDSPWKKWADEMWIKTAIRSLCKMLPQLPEAQASALHSEYTERGFPSPVKPDAIEIEAELINEETGEVEPPPKQDDLFSIDEIPYVPEEREPGQEG